MGGREGVAPGSPWNQKEAGFIPDSSAPTSVPPRLLPIGFSPLKPGRDAYLPLALPSRGRLPSGCLKERKGAGTEASGTGRGSSPEREAGVVRFCRVSGFRGGRPATGAAEDSPRPPHRGRRREMLSVQWGALRVGRSDPSARRAEAEPAAGVWGHKGRRKQKCEGAEAEGSFGPSWRGTPPQPRSRGGRAARASLNTPSPLLSAASRTAWNYNPGALPSAGPRGSAVLAS